MVKLYTTGCPKCKVLKKKLDEFGIEYETKTDQDEMIKLGFMSVPMLDVDGDIKDFLEANNWIKQKGIE